jgi:drug/metabolite transporter (DMT)-like permease
MRLSLSAHTAAVLQALLVTFLWSTSWVLIKIGLEDIPALTFAGLRYFLAFLALLPFTMRAGQRAALRRLTPNRWLHLAILGILLYAATQGAQFVGLFYLPAITVSLLLSFTAVIVALIAIPWLGERPTLGQWLGAGLYIGGVLLYFRPGSSLGGDLVGFLVVLGGVLANAASAVLGRQVNRSLDIPPALITTVSMGIGSILLLFAGLAWQGWAALGLVSWAIILWLAVVNSAFAFTLWNRTLRTLSALESSIINNTMFIQIPILAWLFLDERLTAIQIAGMVAAGLGIPLVQLRPPRSRPTYGPVYGPVYGPPEDVRKLENGR